jgi:hypothetical protein
MTQPHDRIYTTSRDATPPCPPNSVGLGPNELEIAAV